MRCRSCGSPQLYPILSLGKTPLANALLTEGELNEPEPIFPLEVILCAGCALVQLTETVPPEALFRDYLYFSSYSDTMVQHARESAGELIASRGLRPDSLVVEVASNDGYMLRAFVESGIPVLGIEPARNIATVAHERGIRTLPEFFSRALANEVRLTYGPADVILANNVLAHVPDINDFVSGIRALLKDNGVFVIETPYVRDLVDNLEFDTIYHEHVFYYSLTALDHLFRRNGLSAIAVSRIRIHGGSLRIAVGLTGEAVEDGSVSQLLGEEKKAGLAVPAYYHSFAERVGSVGENLNTLLYALKSQGKRIAAYGAAAKGSTLLNFFGIGRDILDFVVDRSPLKQGRYMPGVHLAIFPPERLLDLSPDYVLLLTWNFADEILHQQRAYRSHGGKFILPLPEVKVV